jgi:hypothetical protein
MGRLEHACREALTRNPLQLYLNLTHVTEMDGTAAALLQRLRDRGAQVSIPTGSGAEDLRTATGSGGQR